MRTISRRNLIQSLLGLSASALVGCDLNRPLPPTGQLLSPNFAIGHRLRESFVTPPDIREWQPIHTLIAGGGVAGLTAAWSLQRAGMLDFRLFELEERMGGTSQSQHTEAFAYPWGAHYITTPMPENQGLIELLREMGIIEGTDPEGFPIVAEQYLCRDPEERVFFEDQWEEGLFPKKGATAADLEQIAAFHAKMYEWSQKRDASGRRLFSIPIATGSTDPILDSLDQISMLDWMLQQGWDSPRLKWYVDYACRDDYGLTIERTSARAAILYYASRLRTESSDSQDVITWPSGNGHIVNYLRDKLSPHLQGESLVCSITPETTGNGIDVSKVVVLDLKTQQYFGYLAEHVVFAGPQFIAKHVVQGLKDRSGDALSEFRYGWWLVANIHLRNRPQEAEYPLCWDNVFYASKSLGYVVSTHQSGNDYGPTVFTWYYPFADANSQYTREELLTIPWKDWADLVLTDMELAHPDIRSLVTRLDVMRWGHAMIQPYPGFLSSPTRAMAASPYRNVHFANTDLSGIALLEEAFYHGDRAAKEILYRIAQ